MQPSVLPVGMCIRASQVGVLSSHFRLTGHGPKASVACESARSANMHISRCTILPKPARSATAVLWAASVVALAWLVPPAAHAQDSGLFSAVPEVAAQPQSPASPDATTVRRRVVEIDLGRLRRAQVSAAESPRPEARSKSLTPLLPRRAAAPVSEATLPLNLFEDVSLTGVVERTAATFSGGYSLSGRLVGEPLGSMTLVVNGETVVGTVRTLGGTYQIWPAGNGLYAISEVEQPPLDCEVLEPHGDGAALAEPAR